jgi:hypothetical protein
MYLKNAICLFSCAILIAGCKNSGDDPLPPQPNPPAVNQPPTANAGADQLVLTGAAVSLNGSGSDSDGSIATLAWTQTGGTAVTLTGAATGTPTFTAPAAAATLEFSLTVTDNLGAARSDTVSVTVNGAPVANAGADQSVTVSTNVALSGSGTDDGSIASYAWTQSSGASVTLTGGDTAAPTFTAPSSAGMLVFQLTVTDNQGATHADSINVSVNSLAAPVIVRQPTHATAYEHGIALIFVVAQGENLNYEWHYASGNLWTSGPEPYMIRGRQGGLQTSSDGECYYVIVSNSAGSVTSEEGCLTVHDLDGDFEPDDDNPGDNHAAAVTYGNAMFEVLFAAVGPATGGRLTGAFGGNPSMVPLQLGPGSNCSGGGRWMDATLDGQAITQGTTLPLGQHTVTMIWDQCETSNPDEPTFQSGGVMIEYDFPNEFGVGTYTMYFSGHGEHPLFEIYWEALNGILHVNLARTVGATGLPQDEIVVTLDDHFCIGPLRMEPMAADSIIELERRYANSEIVEDAYMDFNVYWNTYDGGGHAGTMYGIFGSDIGLHFNPDDNNDDGVEPFSSDDHVEVWSSPYYLGRILAVGGAGGWRFTLDEPEDPQFPGDDD